MSSHSKNIIRDCANHLGLAVSELMSIARTAPRRYFVWEIDKRSGKGKRTVCHPARELKSIQHDFLRDVLNDLPVHAAATAYVEQSSIRRNASEYVYSRVILKLDFANFFNSLLVHNWLRYARDQFQEWSEEELDFTSRILFWGNGTYVPTCLAIGSPTSPLLSNVLMYEVDENLAIYAERNDLKYTRYADDITLSSRTWLDYNSALQAVRDALWQARYTSVQLNDEKTILVSDRSSRRITGLVVTPDKKISLGRDRKRLISAMVHHVLCRTLTTDNIPKLAGLLAFAADAEPEFVERLKEKYSTDLIVSIMRHERS